MEIYVAIAIALAANRERLTSLRNGLRAQLQTSPLCDETRFAAQMEDVIGGYRSVKID